MCVTPEGYGHMTQMLLGLANGRVILTLEVCMVGSHQNIMYLALLLVICIKI